MDLFSTIWLKQLSVNFILLHKLSLPETVRVNPDEIRMIEPMEGVRGSIITFTNNDVMRYQETPRQIRLKEWRLRYFWPNLERLIMAILGGLVGSLLTMLAKGKSP